MIKILLIVFMSLASATAIFTLAYTITDIIREYRAKRKLAALENAIEEISSLDTLEETNAESSVEETVTDEGATEASSTPELSD